MPRSYFRVRLALVGIFAVFALGFLVPPGRAQPGRPPGFPAPPRPPGFPAPIRPPTFPAAPGGITGISGTGISGAGISGIGGTGISGIGGTPGFGGPSRSEWFCSGCRYVVGTGPVRPNVTTCPGCGARFSNPGVGAPGATAPGSAPGASAPELMAPELPPYPAAGPPGTSPAPAQPTAPVVPPSIFPAEPESATASDAPEPRKGWRTILVVVIVCAGLFLFGAMALLAIVVMKANAPQKARRPKRRAIDLDD